MDFSWLFYFFSESRINVRVESDVEGGGNSDCVLECIVLGIVFNYSIFVI